MRKKSTYFIRIALILNFLFFNSSYFAGQEKDSADIILHQKIPYAQKLIALKVLINKNNDFDKGLKMVNKTLILAKKNKDKITQGFLLRKKADAYYFSGKLDSASVYFYQSLALLEKEKDTKELALLYNDIARLYRKTRDFPRALKNYDLALKLYEEMNDAEGIATIYNESGVVYEYMENYTEARKRYQKSLDIQKIRKDLVGEGYALEFIGGSYLAEKKTKRAEDYLLHALKIRNKTKDEFAIALNLQALGNLYLETQNFNKAEYYLKASNQIAKKLNYLDLMSQNYHQLSVLFEQQGNYKEAFSSLQIFKKMNDSIFNLGKTQQIEELSVKYETAEKDVEIIAQKSKILKRNVALFSLVGILLVGFLSYRSYRHKQKIKLQKEILHQQDIATKAVIDAEDNERKRMATHLHDGIGQLLTAVNMNVSMIHEFKNDEQNFGKILERTKGVLDEAMTDVRTLAHQIMPNMLIKNSLGTAVRNLIEKSRSPKLEINLKIENLHDDLNQNIQVVVFRVIQESINNTIKHAEAKTIYISLVQRENFLKTSISDDGKGFNPLKVARANDGMGLENIKSRIQFLKGKIFIESAPGKGTKIEVDIPLLQG